MPDSVFTTDTTFEAVDRLMNFGCVLHPRVRGGKSYIHEGFDPKAYKYNPNDFVGGRHNVSIDLEASALVDLDMDHPFARRLAARMIVAATTAYGRDTYSEPSHYLFAGKPMKSDKAILGGENYGELLSKGRYVTGPGSYYAAADGKPEGNIVFFNDSMPTPATNEDVAEAFGHVMVASFIYSKFDKGRRHDLMKDVSGFLVKAGMEPNKIVSMLECVATLDGQSRDWNSDFKRAVEDSIRNHEHGHPVAGYTKLIREHGFTHEDLRRIAQLLGLEEQVDGVVWTGDNLIPCVNDVIDEISKPGDIFNRAGSLVSIEKSVPCSVLQMDRSKYPPVPMPKAHNAVSLRARIMRSIKIYKKTRGKPQPILCPEAVQETILASFAHRFPTLTGISSAPFLDANGTIVSGTGYHPGTGLWIDCESIDISKCTVNESRRFLLEEVLAEFPFVSDQDKAVALSILFTVGHRQMMTSAPCFYTNAPQRSSGKTALLRLLFQLGTGRVPAVTSWPSSEEEMVKKLVSLFKEAHPFVLFDDVSVVRSRTFSSAVTSPTFSERTLGVNSSPIYSTAVTWALTGNNATIMEDVAARTLRCELDPNVERPEMRKFQRINLDEWAAENRSKAMGAVLTIMKSYRDSGEKVVGIGTRFNEWARMVRDPLMWIGLPDIAEGFDESREADPDTQRKHALIENLRRVFRGLEFKPGEVAKSAANDTELAGALSAFKQCEKGISAPAVTGVLRQCEKTNSSDGKLLKIKEKDGRHCVWKIRKDGDLQEEEEIPF